MGCISNEKLKNKNNILETSRVNLNKKSMVGPTSVEVDGWWDGYNWAVELTIKR